MIGRADIEGSKSNVAMDAWLPQASYPCGNFSDTSYQKQSGLKGSIGHAFAVCIGTGYQNQVSFSPFGLQEISVLFELTVGHLRYFLTDVPPQPNSPPDHVFRKDHSWLLLSLVLRTGNPVTSLRNKQNNDTSSGFSAAKFSHLGYTSYVILQSRTRVKLNRVFFPRWFCQARSLGCGFAG